MLCKLLGHRYETHTTWDDQTSDYKVIYFTCKRCGHIQKKNLSLIQGEYIG